MAGGKLSARQKMINLMYLVFIAMLAMQMDKKVLSAFGSADETVSESNITAAANNTASLTSLAGLAVDQPEKYGPLNTQANALSTLSNEYDSYLAGIKGEMKAGLEDPTNYEAMSGGDKVDEMFFKEGKQTAKGQEYVAKLEGFKNDLLKLMPSASDDLKKKINKRFNTDAVKSGKKGEQGYLEARYEGFPLIASIYNVSKIQSDIKATETEVYNTLVGGQMKSDVSMTNYDAMVVFDKNAYYPGEQLSGKIVLGKNDPSLKASRVVINGGTVPASRIKAGQVDLAGSAGNVGEKELKGSFYFMENGEEVEIKIVGGKYSVIPMPNQAVISADKMNVVYRGVPNPISISIPGIPDNKVTGSAPGMTKTGSGSYVMNPPAQRELTISATGVLPNGKKVNTSKKFRVKDIPAPTGQLSSQDGFLKMSKANLAKKSVGAVLKDFVFDLKVGVAGFSVKVPGKPTIKCNGTRFNAAAARAIQKAKKGDPVIIFDIKAKLTGNSTYRLKKTSQVTIEITS